jgi:hypothetical protein
LTRLKDYDEVFIDTLFPAIYDEILELLRKESRVYYLKDTIMLKKLRKENNLRKTDIVDARLLARVSRDRSKQLTVEEMMKKIEFDPLINKYELFTERVEILKH